MRLVFREHLRGSYHLLDVSLEHARAFLRKPTLRVEGELTLADFATKRPCTGTIALKIANEQRIPYDLRFLGDDGRVYQLCGQRDLSVPKIVDALTTLPATLCDESGRELGRAMLDFDARNELGALLRSVRVRS
jgi:hypothetical protein